MVVVGDLTVLVILITILNLGISFKEKSIFLKYMHKTVILYNSIHTSKKTRNNPKSISKWLNQEWLDNVRSTIDLQNILLS